MTTSEMIVMLVIALIVLYMFKPELFAKSTSKFKRRVSKYGYSKPLTRRVSRMSPAYPINSNIAFGPSNIYTQLPDAVCKDKGECGMSHM